MILSANFKTVFFMKFYTFMVVGNNIRQNIPDTAIAGLAYYPGHQIRANTLPGKAWFYKNCYDSCTLYCLGGVICTKK